MTTLLIPTQSVPLTIDLSAIESMTQEQFSQFCLANRDLRIERTANGEVIIMSPAFSDIGNRNGKIALQLGNWAEQDGTVDTPQG
jgi:Uma2 family endonuclease